MSEFPEGVALVAGGSGGIGAAIARGLAAAGARVALTYRSRRDAAEAVAASIEAAGGVATIHAVDLADPHAVGALLDELAAAAPIHTVVHAVGSDIRMRFISEVPLEEWRAVMQSDVDGFFHLLRASLPYLRKSRGSIVAVTSAGLIRYPARDILSVAPKAAIEALIRGVAREEGRYSVRANSVAVGVVDAGIFQRLAQHDLSPRWIEAATANAALGRVGAPEDVANAVVFLASARAGYVTGQRLAVDGGYAI
jgi:NAD(P)-dependent dehydrogenase (short-subunit alcohol dehydrogenase family)